MTVRLMLLVGALAQAALPTQAQEPASALPGRKTIVVHEFSVPSGVRWPYDGKQFQLATVAQLKGKYGDRAEIVTDAPEDQAGVLYLEGEIVSWNAGNRAKRMFIGVAGGGRETARIHFWLVGPGGNRVFESTDTVKQSYWGGGYAPSVGELLQPFADKIANRVSDSRAY